MFYDGIVACWIESELWSDIQELKSTLLPVVIVISIANKVASTVVQYKETNQCWKQNYKEVIDPHPAFQ